MPKKKTTEEQVKQKMAALGLKGWSTMGEFTPEDHLKQLNAIEAHKRKQARERRKKK